MTLSVFIDGAAGTTGLEIVERLALRPEFTLIALDEAQRKSDIARRDAFHAADFAVLCLPDDAARDAVRLAGDAKVRIVDASSAHRVADGWTYGFPELIGRQEIANARLVSNPGCYPTGFIALIAPLVRAGLARADWAYSCNAVSGYSGGGKALIARFEDAASDGPGIAFRAYALTLGHKHVAEMQRHAGLAHAPLFAPAVIPAYRGMLVEIPLPLAALGADIAPASLRDCLRAFYADSAVVTVHEDASQELLIECSAPGDDRLDIYVCAAADGSQARLIARLDNLGKGAGGAAVQNLNLMAGMPETSGLRL